MPKPARSDLPPATTVNENFSSECPGAITSIRSCGGEMDDAQDAVVELFGQIASFWGFTRTQGRIYGLLYVSHEPLDQWAVRERLGISAGSASMTLASMCEWGMLRRDGRKYVAEADLWTLITSVLREREYTRVQDALSQMRSLSVALSQASVPSEQRTKLKFMRKRIDYLIRFFEGCQALFDAVVRQTPIRGILNTLAKQAARFRVHTNSSTKRGIHVGFGA